ncbi:MAG: hypothetical protein ABIH37_01895 [archaeon]
MKKRGERAQGSVYWILPVVVIAAIILFMFVILKSVDKVSDEGKKKKIDDAFSSQGINLRDSGARSLILECIESGSKESVFKIGLQGGYNSPPERSKEIIETFIPYYYYEGEIYMPYLEEVEKEISSYFNDNLKNCINNIDLEGFTLNYQNSETKSRIKESYVSFIISLSLNVKKDSILSHIQIDEFQTKINASIYSSLEIADYILESHKEDSELICMSCIKEMADERNLLVEFTNFGGEEDKYTTFVLISEKGLSESTPFELRFLNKYLFNEIAQINIITDISIQNETL